jgi:uncharacterized membrane protein
MRREAERMIGKLVRAVLGGLLLAGLVHVVAVLLVPEMAPRDAVSRIHDVVPTGEVTAIPADGSVLPDLDPYFVHAACTFDVSAGPIEVTGAMPDTLWTFAVVSKTGGIVTSLERSASVDNRLDVVVGRPGPIEQLRLSRAATLSPGTSFAAVPDDLGFVLIRAFAPEGAARETFGAALAKLDCAAADE